MCKRTNDNVSQRQMIQGIYIISAWKACKRPFVPNLLCLDSNLVKGMVKNPVLALLPFVRWLRHLVSFQRVLFLNTHRSNNA